MKAQYDLDRKLAERNAIDIETGQPSSKMHRVGRKNDEWNDGRGCKGCKGCKGCRECLRCKCR